ncbi:MAG TPA: Asp-tRNA(Asn)/Glu-tRNA(Gln) amidotransferase subunit GatA [Acidimicrobiales bacterium]|nr:Asp-tRNA(Asn)/Glu-tRNA(Gln) amidotransferase subunit GatA [Acidimicrobiales bacterium]
MTASTDTARAIAAAVRAGETTAAEVLEEHLARVGRHEAEIHAFNLVLEDQARAQARAVDQAVREGRDPGPLAGVPVALKDNLCTRGIPTTCSSRILEGWRPPYDATVVTRLAEAGAVFVGKTNMDEFAMGSSTENSAFGPTRNPHDPARVPGGSSGGSAAAVAAGFATLGLGSDTGGSIRQPAALCGVVGAKPTYGLVSRYGLVAFASSLDQIGPFALDVADAALLLDVIAGPDRRDSTCLADPPPAASARLDAGVEELRVGVVRELANAEGLSPEVQGRLQEAAGALSAAGAKVDEVSVPAAVYGLSAYYLIAPAEASSNLARYDGVRYGLRAGTATGGREAADITQMYLETRSAGFGPEVKRRIMLGTYALSAGYYDAYYGKAQQVRTLMVRDFEAAYRDFDVLLAPTAPGTAFGLGAKTADPLTMYLNDVCTIPSNLVGHPAVSVPFGTGADGLPLGVQVLAPALGETVMFQVAAALESAAPATPVSRMRGDAR